MSLNQSILEMVIPEDYWRVCDQYHSGPDSMFYAIASTDRLRPATYHGPNWAPRRPFLDRNMTKEEWHLWLWLRLRNEIKAATKIAKEEGYSDDENTLHRFSAYCTLTILRLKSCYSLYEFPQEEV